MSDLNPQPWHSMDAATVIEKQQTDATSGLTQQEASARLTQYGPNQLPEPKGTPAWKRFLEQFHNPLVYVLLVSAAVTALTHEDAHVEVGAILLVVLANAVIGYIQESKAHAAMQGLKKLMSLGCTVIRDGAPSSIPAEQLVPGDLVLIQSGDRVPADARVVRTRDLRVDEALLTGESLPVEKQVAPVAVDSPIADRLCMVFSGALVASGQAYVVVTETGARTELGLISKLMSDTKQLETPLTKRLAQLSITLTWVILGLAVVAFLIGMARGMSLNEVFLAAVALAVAAIPEGLPAAVTIILAIGVSRMARRNAIVRRLPAVEALGSTSVICTDKTGTLTRNEMTVTHIVTSRGMYHVSGTGYAPAGRICMDDTDVMIEDHEDLYALCHIAALCGDASLKLDGEHWVGTGDPTEIALVTLAGKSGLSPQSLKQTWERIDVIPFESERQYMATLNAHPSWGHVVCVKGAVERVLALCEKQLAPTGAVEPMDPQWWLNEASAMAAQGMRVLALAWCPTQLTQLADTPPSGDMLMVGLVGMIDPPRDEAVQAVSVCRGAGITVKMITGDHPLTAAAIAHQCGITDSDTDPVVQGVELTRADQDALPEMVARTNVFARVAPEQKLQLVHALQKQERVVAMTGDGVNDAPALKAADIGVAMGAGGTEAAREAAAVVLADDNFATIAAAVEEGRVVYDNIRKFVAWTLPTNAGEGLIVMAGLALGTQMPILPVQILWINMSTAILLGITLAFQPIEPGIMRKPPRAPSEPLLTNYLAQRVLLVALTMVIGGLMVFFIEKNRVSLEAARTAAGNVLVFIQIGYLFSSRSVWQPIYKVPISSNWWVPAGACAMIIAQLFWSYDPMMQRLFRTGTMDILAWLDVLLVTLASVVLSEIQKAWQRRRYDAPAPAPNT